MESHGGIILTGNTEVLGEKREPQSLCPPQIPHGIKGSEPRLPWREASDQQLEPWHRLTILRKDQRKYAEDDAAKEDSIVTKAGLFH
jgi:hypothetical protein